MTQTKFLKVMRHNPSHFAATGPGKDTVANRVTARHPVEKVSRNDAAEFCEKHSEQEQLKPFYFRALETMTMLDGTGHRLPPEAQWEFACRAGTTTKYWTRNQDQDLAEAGWTSTNFGGITDVVGELYAHLHCDIHGNAWGWGQHSSEPT